MGERNYLRYFTPTDRLRVLFTTAHGDVQGFVVQFEIFIEEEWMPVVRYDTAHEFLGESHTIYSGRRLSG